MDTHGQDGVPIQEVGADKRLPGIDMCWCVCVCVCDGLWVEFWDTFNEHHGIFAKPNDAKVFEVSWACSRSFAPWTGAGASIFWPKHNN